jgi:hypothetical protein
MKYSFCLAACFVPDTEYMAFVRRTSKILLVLHLFQPGRDGNGTVGGKYYFTSVVASTTSSFLQM